MAIVTNTYLTFDAAGIREDLSDTIYMISPEETPLVSMMAKRSASSTLVEWQTDALAAAVTNNAVVEGDDITSFTAVVATTRVGNYTQILRKDLIISGTEEAVSKAGRRSEIARETAKKGAELKRDLESSIFANNGGVAGNSTTARELAGLGAWVKTNTDFGAGGGDPTYTSGVPGAARTDGTERTFTEAILQTVVREMWTSGAELKYLFVGPVNKEDVSAFSGIATLNYDLSGTPRPTAVIGAADVYVSNYGYLSVIPSRWQREVDGWFLDPDFLALRHLRPFQRVPLAKTGDAEKRMLILEVTMKVSNEEALGIAADLSTS